MGRKRRIPIVLLAVAAFVVAWGGTTGATQSAPRGSSTAISRGIAPSASAPVPSGPPAQITGPTAPGTRAPITSFVSLAEHTRGSVPTSITNVSASASVSTSVGASTSTKSVLYVHDSRGSYLLGTSPIPNDSQQVTVTAADFANRTMTMLTAEADASGTYSAPVTTPMTVKTVTPGAGASLSAFVSHRQSRARLEVAIGFCITGQGAPAVIGSIFGPLIQGNEAVYCQTPTPITVESVLQQNALDLNWHNVSNVGQASAAAVFLEAPSYAPCYLQSSSPWSFRTVWYVDIGGIPDAGVTGGRQLGCANLL